MPTLLELKNHLRIEHTDEDTYLEALISSAIAQIENDTQRKFTETNLTLKLDGFEPEIELPVVPVAGVVSVKYVDENEQIQQLQSSDWYLDTRPMKAILSPAYLTSWPRTSDIPESVEITYTVGGGTMPTPIKQAALLLIGHWYANRETVVVGTITSQLPMAYQSIIQPYRVPF